MPELVGVAIGKLNKVTYYDRSGLAFETGDRVVVATERGLHLARVVVPLLTVPDEEAPKPLHSVLRVATDEDIQLGQELGTREKEALTIAKQMASQHGLPMKMLQAEYTFDGSRIILYFSAEARVDFRALVKDLSARLGVRVELSQVGVRDQARLAGGVGVCGRLLCCAGALGQFQPVSIRMARTQGLALNPVKLSGVCGRLLCCLRFEQPFYEEAAARLPAPGCSCLCEGRTGRVVDRNLLKDQVCVEFEDGGVKWVCPAVLRNIRQPSRAGEPTE